MTGARQSFFLFIFLGEGGKKIIIGMLTLVKKSTPIVEQFAISLSILGKFNPLSPY